MEQETSFHEVRKWAKSEFDEQFPFEKNDALKWMVWKMAYHRGFRRAELLNNAPNVQRSDTTTAASNSSAKDKNPSNSINNSPEQWKEEWEQKLDKLKRLLQEAKEDRCETTEGRIWHEIKGMEKAQSFFLPIIERLQEKIKKLEGHDKH